MGEGRKRDLRATGSGHFKGIEVHQPGVLALRRADDDVDIVAAKADTPEGRAVDLRAQLRVDTADGQAEHVHAFAVVDDLRLGQTLLQVALDVVDVVACLRVEHVEHLPAGFAGQIQVAALDLQLHAAGGRTRGLAVVDGDRGLGELLCQLGKLALGGRHRIVPWLCLLRGGEHHIDRADVGTAGTHGHHAAAIGAHHDLGALDVVGTLRQLDADGHLVLD